MPLITCDITEYRRSKNRAILKDVREILPVIFFVIFERSSCRTCQEKCTECRVFCKKKMNVPMGMQINFCSYFANCIPVFFYSVQSCACNIVKRY